MPGLGALPSEIQVIFWLMFIVLGTLCGFVVYWTKRYIDSQDQSLEKVRAKLSKISDELIITAGEIKTINISMKAELRAFQNDIEKGLRNYKDETHLLTRELSVAQTRMIVVNENTEKALKTTNTLVTVMKSEIPKIQENQVKTKAIEATQQKIITIVQRLSEKFVKVSSKPEE
jgi:DNA-directed RNA polymerase subunit H (RpoH/RPB5)